jgi:hypothetical protein
MVWSDIDSEANAREVKKARWIVEKPCSLPLYLHHTSLRSIASAGSDGSHGQMKERLL